MLKKLEKSITLQLLVFYCLFLLPLLLGGGELYLFQRDALQRNARQTDLGIAQALALDVQSTVRTAAEEDMGLSRSEAASQLNLAQLTSIFATIKRSYSDVSLYFVCDESHHLLISYPSVNTSNRSAKQAHQAACEYVPSASMLRNSTSQPSPIHLSAITHEPVVSLTQPIVNVQGQTIGILGMNVSLNQLSAHIQAIQRQLASNGEIHILIIDQAGQALASTDRLPLQKDLRTTSPGLQQALLGQQGNLTVHAQNRDWLYSYAPVTGTRWAAVVQRPTDVTFATIISFQNSLVLALVMLIFGASFFWFVLHGWVVAPLSKLAQAVRLIKPDQAANVTASNLLAKDRSRVDEVGQLIGAFSMMEEEIHVLFRKSDERSQVRLHTLDAIMRSMDEGVLLERPDGQFLYANQSFTQFVGLVPQELLLDDASDAPHVEKHLLALIEEPQAYLEAIYNAEQDDTPHTIEFHVKGYYNSVGHLVSGRRTIHARIFYVRDQADQLLGRGKIFQDVTRQNEAEQIKKNLLAIISHELRTPLTTIKGYATSLLETDVELDSASQQHFLQRIVQEGDRMADLVTSLLEMSQLEAGTLKLTPSLHQLEALIEQAIGEDHQETIQVQVPADIPLLYIDQRRFEMVLRNLIENARCYAGKEAQIEISATFQRSHEGCGLYLDIADTGPGFPSELTERIFDRFYQVDGGRQRSRSGVGLGLAICRGFIAAHGGRIWAENRSDGQTGAIFHIWLPSKVLYTPGVEPDVFELHKML